MWSSNLVDGATSLEERGEIRLQVHDHLTERGIDHATVECLDVDEADSEQTDRTPHTH